MTRVQVLGAGECGLPLAHRLLGDGVAVTLVTDRDPEAVLSGSVTSTQVKFSRTLDLEYGAGLGTWREKAPYIRGIRMALAVDRAVVTSWATPFDSPAQSVDQRTVFAHRMTTFVEAGGDLEVRTLSVDELDARTGEYDLTVVTRASKDLAARFPDDPNWPVPAAPMRQVAVVYLDGVEPDPEDMGLYLAMPGLGEAVSVAGLTGAPGHERRCDTLMFAAIPGGPMDVFGSATTPAERLHRVLETVERCFPPELAQRFRAAELTDSGGTLEGAVTAAMRQPVATLPSGAAVLGGADVVCRMDPAGAQGANSAVACAFHYADAIAGRGAGPFDEHWMHATARGWLDDTAHPAARWTKTLLDQPPALGELLVAGAEDPALARTFAATFVKPADMKALAL